MKYLILFILYATYLFPQVNSGQGTWTDPPENDLAKIYLYGDTASTGMTAPTTLRDSVVGAGIGVINWTPPYAGRWKTGVKAVDDSANVSSMSNVDTTTFWSATAASHVTDSLRFYFDDDSLSVGEVTSWTDIITGTFNINNDDGDGTSKGAMVADSGWTADGNDFIQEDTPGSVSDSMRTIELVVFIPNTDTTTNYVIAAASSNGQDIAFSIDYDTGVRTYLGFRTGGLKATIEYAVNVTPILNGYHHIIATTNGTTNAVYVDSVYKEDLANQGIAYGANRIVIGSVVAPPVNNFRVRLFRVYTKVLSPAEVKQNFESTSVQGKL